MSNEHLDMSGNPMDSPFLCESCQRELQEEKAYGIDYDDSLLFCSASCVEDWEEKQLEQLVKEVPHEAD